MGCSIRKPARSPLEAKQVPSLHHVVACTITIFGLKPMNLAHGITNQLDHSFSFERPVGRLQDTIEHSIHRRGRHGAILGRRGAGVSKGWEVVRSELCLGAQPAYRGALLGCQLNDL